MKSFKSDEEPEGLKCQYCDQIIKHIYSLERHIKVVHEGCRPFVCHCSKAFATREQFTRHTNSKHSMLKPYVCELGCSSANPSSVGAIFADTGLQLSEYSEILVHELRLQATLLTRELYRVSAFDALCLLLRRLWFPNRLSPELLWPRLVCDIGCHYPPG